jgi:hypothetical protein
MKEVIKGKQTTREQPVERLLRPFQEFAKLEASGGILLLLCTVTALVWANSPWADTYFSFWRTTLTVGFGEVLLSKPLLLWINDGLMAVFFFVVGLEIKREVLVGELNSVRKAALPIVAALGGGARACWDLPGVQRRDGGFTRMGDSDGHRYCVRLGCSGLAGPASSPRPEGLSRGAGHCG